jgi:SHAQKYF class myb-like DNA-binding protein
MGQLNLGDGFIPTSVNKLLNRKRLRVSKIIQDKKREENNLESSNNNVGKWTSQEHEIFINACLQNGNSWSKIQQALKNRTTPQIRSHAQKYIIKLCKKYQIKIKSKKFRNLKKIPEQKLKRRKTLPLSEMSARDKQILNIFNYYSRSYKPFTIEKIYNKELDIKNNNKCKHSQANKVIAERINKRLFKILKSDRNGMSTSRKRKNVIQEGIILNYNNGILFSLTELRQINQTFCDSFITNNYDYDTTVYSAFEWFKAVQCNTYAIEETYYSDNLIKVLQSLVTSLDNSLEKWRKSLCYLYNIERFNINLWREI